MSPEPFRIAIPDADIADLKARLANTRLAPDFGNQDGGYGLESAWIAPMLEYWRDGFDWRAQEAAINAWPQFKVESDGIAIHYLHVKGKGPNPKPLLLTHGWPWTFWDWNGLIGPLSDPAAHGGDPADSFDLVIPSLPGFGFSTPLTRTGVQRRVTAGLWQKLMRQVLGYDRYFAAGGDWGALVTMDLGELHPEGLEALFVSLPVAPGVDVRSLAESEWAPEEAWMSARMKDAAKHVQSHMMVHTREPQTLAIALNDSPAGLASWLWTRRRNWSDCEGDALNAFSHDFLCATASIYWFTGTIASSLRYYAEAARMAPLPPREGRRIEVPSAFASAPKELLFTPRRLVAEKVNLQHWSLPAKGGHFLPAEQPQILVDEYRSFFSRYR